MKKRHILALSALMLAGATIPVSADAQRGEKSLSLNGGYTNVNESGYATVSFNYTFANHFRIAPDIGYVFRSRGASAFVFDVDMHFPFRVGKGVNLYPLVGLTFNNWSLSPSGHATRLGGNFGGGVDLYLTSNLKLNLQCKYTVINDFSGVYVGMGIGYVF